MDESKLGRLEEWIPPLGSVKDLRSFLGFMSYYRAFIPHFADLTAPLTQLLRKTTNWQWSEEATKAVKGVKQALLEARSRYAWDPERPDRVTTDASGTGLGAVLE